MTDDNHHVTDDDSQKHIKPSGYGYILLHTILLNYTRNRIPIILSFQLPDFISFVSFLRYTLPLGMGSRISLCTLSTKEVVDFFPLTTNVDNASRLSIESTMEINQADVCEGIGPRQDFDGRKS